MPDNVYKNHQCHLKIVYAGLLWVDWVFRDFNTFNSVLDWDERKWLYGKERLYLYKY